MSDNSNERYRVEWVSDEHWYPEKPRIRDAKGKLFAICDDIDAADIILLALNSATSSNAGKREAPHPRNSSEGLFPPATSSDALVRGCEKHRGNPLLGACPDCKRQESQTATSSDAEKRFYQDEPLPVDGKLPVFTATSSDVTISREILVDISETYDIGIARALARKALQEQDHE